MRRFLQSAPGQSSSSAPGSSSSSSDTSWSSSPSSPAIQSYDDAVASGTLMVTADNVRCKCSPAERHAAGWGRRSNEWPVHARRLRHQAWIKSQGGSRSGTERSGGAVPVGVSSCPLFVCSAGHAHAECAVAMWTEVDPAGALGVRSGPLVVPKWSNSG